MIGQIPYSPSFTMDQTANTCSENENLSRALLTALVADAVLCKNLATFVRQLPGSPLPGLLQIVPSDAPPADDATFLFSTQIFVSGTQTAVDVYRLSS